MYTVWFLADEDQSLWLATECDTFEQASAAWLEGVRQGKILRITEDVPIGLYDKRSAVEPLRRSVTRIAARIEGLPATSQLREPVSTGHQAFMRMLDANDWTTIEGHMGTAAGRLATRYPQWIEQRREEPKKHGAALSSYRLTTEGRRVAQALRNGEE